MKERKQDFIRFVRAGSAPRRGSSRQPSTWLEAARDWVCNFDLPEFQEGKRTYSFPHDVCTPNLRVDGYIISRRDKVCVLGPELTSPMEENIEKWHGKKVTKYRNWFEEDGNKDWTVWQLVLEVGARGWVPPSFAHQLRRLGFTKREASKLSSQVSMIARKCSYVIWLNRANKDFRPYRLHG